MTVFMSSHILAEVDRLATRVAIVHQGRLIEELDSDALEAHRDRRLEIGARNLDGAEHAPPRSGPGTELEPRTGEARRLELRDAAALEAPDDVARLLVAAGVPPTHLALARESLEDHFIRLTGTAGTVAA